MIKKRKALIIAVILFLTMTSCSRYSVIEYEEKEYGDMKDKNVLIKYYAQKNQSDLFLKFEQKEIPFELSIICGSDVYEGIVEVRGSLEQGDMIISILDGSKKIWEKKYVPGLIQSVGGRELYEGNYTLRVEFNEAKKGDLRINFATKKMFGF